MPRARVHDEVGQGHAEELAEGRCGVKVGVPHGRLVGVIGQPRRGFPNRAAERRPASPLVLRLAPADARPHIRPEALCDRPGGPEFVFHLSVH